MFWPLSTVAFLAGICASTVLAEDGTSALANGVSTVVDNTNVVSNIVRLKAQLEAVERETLRRLDCQTKTEVSTASGCTEIPGLRSYVSSMINCPLPWGGFLQNGQSVTAYAAPAAASCTPQTRTCSGNSLSGSYQYASCTPYAACALPWGSSIAHGQAVTAYAASSVPNNSSCTPQTRVCNNGALSGNYTAASCTVEAPADPWAGCTTSAATAGYYGPPITSGAHFCTQSLNDKGRQCTDAMVTTSYRYACY